MILYMYSVYVMQYLFFCCYILSKVDSNETDVSWQNKCFEPHFSYIIFSHLGKINKQTIAELYKYDGSAKPTMQETQNVPSIFPPKKDTSSKAIIYYPHNEPHSAWFENNISQLQMITILKWRIHFGIC